MAVCLNTESAYKLFSILTNDKFFVDKSGIIEKINARINTSNRFLCVTKPRRFGKLLFLICLVHIMAVFVIQKNCLIYCRSAAAALT